MLHHVFLSYSHRDSGLMRRIRQDLMAVGMVVWSDERIEPGTPSWKRAIEHAIDHTGCLVVILSPDSKQSEWVGRELDYALARRVPIFAVLVRGDESTAVPFTLIGSQYIDIRTEQGYPAGIQTLIRTVKAALKQTAAAQGPAPAVEQAAPRAAAPSGAAAAGREQTTSRPAVPAMRPASRPSAPRLLWWLLMSPPRLAIFDRTALLRPGAWLGSTLIWLPLFIPAVGAALGLAPPPPSEVELFPPFVLVMALMWLAGGLIGDSDHRARVAALALLTAMVSVPAALGLGGNMVSGAASGVAAGTAAGLTVALLGGVAISAAAVVMAIVLVTVAASPTAGAVAAASAGALFVLALLMTRRHLAIPRRSILGWPVLLALAAAYAALVWLYLLGGWRALPAWL